MCEGPCLNSHCRLAFSSALPTALSAKYATVLHTHALPQQKLVELETRKVRSSLPMTSASSRLLEKRMSGKPIRLDFWLPPATPPRKQNRKSGRRGFLKRAKAVISSRSEKRIRFANLRSGQGAYYQSFLKLSNGLTLSPLPPRRAEPSHGPLEDSAPGTMPVR